MTTILQIPSAAAVSSVDIRNNNDSQSIELDKNIEELFNKINQNPIDSETFVESEKELSKLIGLDKNSKPITFKLPKGFPNPNDFPSDK